MEKKSLEEAPLYYRVHHPDLSHLNPQQLEEGLRDPRLMHALWIASHPSQPHTVDEVAQERAVRYLRTRSWIRPENVTVEEMQTLYQNKQLPQNLVETLREKKSTP